MSKTQQRLIELFEKTEAEGERYDGILSDLNYFNLVSKAAANNSLYNIENNNICMYRCKYEDKESVMMIFSVPMNKDIKGGAHITERVMDVVENVEECFITLNYMNSKEVKDDKFVYVTIIKNIGDRED